MPEEYNPTLSGYENVVNTAIDLSSTDITEEEINDALESLYNG